MINELQINKKSNLGWNNFILYATEFMAVVDSFLLLQLQLNNDDERKLSLDDLKILDYKKTNYHTEMFEFAKMLHFKYFVPKSLKELCRFKIRSHLIKKLNSSNIKYTKIHTKLEHQISFLQTFGLPNYLIDYVLHKI